MQYEDMVRRAQEDRAARALTGFLQARGLPSTGEELRQTADVGLGAAFGQPGAWDAINRYGGDVARGMGAMAADPNLAVQGLISGAEGVAQGNPEAIGGGIGMAGLPWIGPRMKFPGGRPVFHNEMQAVRLARQMELKAFQEEIRRQRQMAYLVRDIESLHPASPVTAGELMNIYSPEVAAHFQEATRRSPVYLGKQRGAGTGAAYRENMLRNLSPADAKFAPMELPPGSFYFDPQGRVHVTGGGSSIITLANPGRLQTLIHEMIHADRDALGRYFEEIPQQMHQMNRWPRYLSSPHEITAREGAAADALLRYADIQRAISGTGYPNAQAFWEAAQGAEPLGNLKQFSYPIDVGAHRSPLLRGLPSQWGLGELEAKGVASGIAGEPVTKYIQRLTEPAKAEILGKRYVPLAQATGFERGRMIGNPGQPDYVYVNPEGSPPRWVLGPKHSPDINMPLTAGPEPIPTNVPVRPFPTGRPYSPPVRRPPGAVPPPRPRARKPRPEPPGQLRLPGLSAETNPFQPNEMLHEMITPEGPLDLTKAGRDIVMRGYEAGQGTKGWGSIMDELAAFNQDREAARLFARLFGSASPRTRVSANTEQALRAYLRYMTKGGDPMKYAEAGRLGLTPQSTKLPSINEAFAGREPTGPKTRPMSEFVQGLPGRPWDAWMLRNLAGNEDLGPNMPGLRRLFAQRYGIPMHGAFPEPIGGERQLARLAGQALDPTLRMLDPTLGGNIAFGQTWEGFRRMAGEPSAPGLIEYMRMHGLLEPGAMKNPAQIRHALQHWDPRWGLSFQPTLIR